MNEAFDINSTAVAALLGSAMNGFNRLSHDLRGGDDALITEGVINASRENVSYSWEQTLQIVEQIETMDSLGTVRREQYSTLFLVAAASGLRIGELLALRRHDIGENTIRVDESVDRAGTIGPCKNAAAYRTVVLADSEGRAAMRALRQFAKHDGLIFHSKNNGTLAETTILTQGLHPP